MVEGFYTEAFDGERITGDSNILIVKPFKEYDISDDLKGMALDRREVCVTYPKKGIDLFSEAIASECPLVIQVDEPFTKRFHFYGGYSNPRLERLIWENVKDRFVNHHHHDEYSLRDALGTSRQLGELLKSQGRRFMSVTNHGSIGGWIKQNNVCSKNNLKSIFGMEAYHGTYRGYDPQKRAASRSAYHLVLIANNEEGFFNIIKIHNDAQINGFYYTPRTCDRFLEEHGRGISATSACMAGFIPRLLMDGNDAEAEERYWFYKSCFDEFYIEIQLIEMEEQRELNRKLIQFARKVGAPIIIGIDSHYLYPENEETHELLMCIRQKRTIRDLAKEDDDTWQFTVKNLYYRNFDQLQSLFRDGFVINGEHRPGFRDDIFTDEVFYEGCMNTRRICACADDIKMDTSIKLPRIHKDSEKTFRDMAWEAFKAKGLDSKGEAYSERLDYELDVICLSGWADYFLITKMIVDKASELKGEFATGLGRGSAAGSLVSYALDITGIDPIEYNLLFERFLDYSRSEIEVNTFEA